ncbi:MAG: hypothetical protein Q9195_004537 [Heterodermia aff. obscurata]
MPKDFVGDDATKQRKENNYRAKKHSKSTDAKEPHGPETLAVGLPIHPVTETQKPTHDCTPPCDIQQLRSKPLPTPLDASIPFKTQFRIVTAVQGWLEEAIFEFFRKWLPEVLEAKGIDVAEKVELTDWAETIGKEMRALPKAATDRIPGTSLMQELRASYQLRNAALKRQQLSLIRLLELLGAASNLVTIIKDEIKIALIGALIGEIQAGSRLLETRLEAAKKAIMHDSDIIKSMETRLSEQLSKVNKAACARCERNRQGVGITLDLFLDNTRKGSTSGGQMAILEDELQQLQESQDTFLPQNFPVQYAKLSPTSSMEIGGPAKPAEDSEKGGIQCGEEGGKEDGKEGGRNDVAILSNSLDHALDGKAEIQSPSGAAGSSTGTSSALAVPGHAEDGQGNSRDYPKAKIPFGENLTTKFNSSASPVQSGSNKGSPFKGSRPKPGNADKNQTVNMLDTVDDAEFTFKKGPAKHFYKKSPSLWGLQRSMDAFLSSKQLFGQANEQVPKSAPSEPTVPNTTASSANTIPPPGTRPINPLKKAAPINEERKQGSSLFSSYSVTAQSEATSGATTSPKEKQAAVSPPATSQPQPVTVQPSTKLNNFPRTSSTPLLQAPSPSPPLGTFPLNPPTAPPTAPPTNQFKFTRPIISQITTCFGTAESLPFNTLYLSEKETQTDGRIEDWMLSTQSITFMMGHRNYSFEELRLADYQRGWGKKVKELVVEKKVPGPAVEKEVPGAFPSSPEKDGERLGGGS